MDIYNVYIIQLNTSLFCMYFSLNKVGSKYWLFKLYLSHTEEWYTEWLQHVWRTAVVKYHLNKTQFNNELPVMLSLWHFQELLLKLYIINKVITWNNNSSW
jgi:hypothetical protein